MERNVLKNEIPPQFVFMIYILDIMCRCVECELDADDL